MATVVVIVNGRGLGIDTRHRHWEVLLPGMELDWILDWNGIYFLYGIAIGCTTFGTVHV